MWEAMDDATRILAELFDGVPNVMFCRKDRDGRYVVVNQAFAERVGRRFPSEVAGRRPRDVFPAELAQSYEQQDAAVLAGAGPLRNALEMTLRPDGSVGWYVTTKVATTDEGEVNGLVSISVDLHASAEVTGPLSGVAAAVDVARRRFAEPLRVKELADIAGMSVAQLERQMRRVFGVSVKQFVLRARVEEAVRLLVTTDVPLAEIATRCGYYDQAAFTRQFKRVVAMTPGEYREAARVVGHGGTPMPSPARQGT